jgi:hypothetical protein
LHGKVQADGIGGAESGDNVPIMLHKPHPSGIMKKYQMKQVKEILEL